MKQKFDFNDINLIPKKCIVESRSECDTTVQLGKHTFNIPVVPANMSSVISHRLAEVLSSNGYFYIMHRFLTNDEIINFVAQMQKKKLITSISIGIKKSDKELISNLYQLMINDIITDIDYITIDVAHGHSETVKEMIEYIKSLLPNTFIIAGNVSTTQAVADLQKWGADAIKVGIAPGFAHV